MSTFKRSILTSQHGYTITHISSNSFMVEHTETGTIFAVVPTKLRAKNALKSTLKCAGFEFTNFK